MIIGAPRSGTTALSRYVGAHPDAFMARIKEVRYFDSLPDLGVDRYAGHFEEGRGARAIGEATPTYMYSTVALRRMRDILPHARLIAILRDPVKRAYSE